MHSGFRSVAPFLTLWLGSLCIAAVSSGETGTVRTPPADAASDTCYTPIPGGWQLRMHGDEFYVGLSEKNTRVRVAGREVQGIDPTTGRLAATAPIGLLPDNPRLHRRPLYPPGDKSLIWNADEREKSPRVSFRPMILAYNAPRFLFDYHSAGGLLGHLHVGLVQKGGDKWFHEWSQITVRYVEGRTEYVLQDEAYPGTTVKLVAVPAAETVGLVLAVDIDGTQPDAALVWAYGGASAFFTNWRLNAPEFAFAPEHCAKDKYLLRDGAFELIRAFDKTDTIVGDEGQSLCIMRALPDWKAHIRGGCSWPGSIAFCPPETMKGRPGVLLAAINAASGPDAQDRTNCIAAGRAALSIGRSTGHLLVGMGGRIEEWLKHPARAFEAALARNQTIADRIVVRSPDPYLNAAATMMAFATEGTWASQAYVHGGWTWRYAYLGWRILYGPTVYGWTDRVRTTIQNHCRLGLIDEGDDRGGLSSYLEGKGFYYNMNEVFIDMVRHYFDYTNDVELMKEFFPILRGMVDRENRRLWPDPNVHLYESALNTWISDSHWYIQGQCTQASAYMLRAHELLADLARRLGQDDAAYRRKAQQVRADMQRILWMKRPGTFAEYLDTRGHRLLHAEPELPTLYHSAEFGSADELQVYQMLHWADTHLKQEPTPGGGRLYWSSNWFPNAGRSYTHSTYELAYGEELNFAETQYLAGRVDEGYALIRATFSGMFNGPTPGGLSCHSHTDGLQRANDEFADATSMWGRAVVEGLFGIRVKRAENVVYLSPCLPSDWPEAAIETPHFSYRARKTSGRVDIEWNSPVETAVRLRLPVRAASSPRARADDREIDCSLHKGVGLSWVELTTGRATHGTIGITFQPRPMIEPLRISAKAGEEVRVTIPGVEVAEFTDPQGLLADARIEDGALLGEAASTSGPGLLFVSLARQEAPSWQPVHLEIQPTESVLPRKYSPPSPDDRGLDRWRIIDLQPLFDANVSDVLRRAAEGAIPPPEPLSRIGFSYWIDHLVTRCKPPCDDAWRAKVGADGITVTADGVPFRSVKTGPNIAVAALHNKTFPPAVSVPIHASGRRLYLMVSGITWPNQSHVVNLRIKLTYQDGTARTCDLVQPTDISDCWSTWCGGYFDTPGAGFENIGGRSGPAGTAEVKDPSRPVAVDTTAMLLSFDLIPGEVLMKADMEVVANDVVFGIMGASVLK